MSCAALVQKGYKLHLVAVDTRIYCTSCHPEYVISHRMGGDLVLRRCQDAKFEVDQGR